MNYHPLVIYFAVGALVSSYLAYLLYFTLLNRIGFVFYYALTNHVASVLLSILAVLTGLSISGAQYVQEKAPFIFLFPHKWLGITLAGYTLVTFIPLWIKQRELSRNIGIVFSFIGFALSVAVLVFGWLLRLIFF
ncbi:hypothetical protein BCF55_0827 [Hydrogenivirga caldilitoris]|uniref:DUF2231 domain-containing protein n=1 Tax=Hydrogenivirga caldilitoris TaxID=246264 RepID=A0A497XQJ4_9AQUI|nr:hypothetical protein [Hydrogenivirga caldilitoris]RLJ70551.1 hypothetical protein BCF55_0827 [Hydrogenivirga caldilitoris]